MNTEEFWSMIEDAKQQSVGNTEKQRKLLIETLSKLSPIDIQEFDRLLWMLMTEAYHGELWDAVWLIGCGCGDDAFYDFRNWLIAQGQKIYEKVLEDPENLVDIVSKEDRFKGLMAAVIVDVAELAYKQKTGKPIPVTGYRDTPVLIGETTSATSEDEIPAKFPRIVAKIGGCEDEDLQNAL